MRVFIVVFLLMFPFMGCGIYSFTGASVPPGLNKIKIYIFDNEAEYVEPQLDIDMTTMLEDRLRSNFGLVITQDEDDAQGFIRGSIVSYEFRPVLTTTQGITEKQRLSITVQINFSNTIDETLDFDGRITKEVDFEGIYEEEKSDLIDELRQQVIDEIITKLFGRW